jgi:transposase InsO family protein
VTRGPTDAWAAQQLREATPYGDGPKSLVRDNDDKFGRRFDAVAEGTGIEVVKIPPSSPDLNPIGERFLGSVRRECLDHVVILSERQLHRALREYVETDFNSTRPHQGLFQRIPARAAARSVSQVGRNAVGLPILSGLHHDCQWAA